jgi:hypothetical protein
LVEPVPPTGQGLGESQSQRSRFPQTCFHTPHVKEAMQSLIKSPDGLLELSCNNAAQGRIGEWEDVAGHYVVQ